MKIIFQIIDILFPPRETDIRIRHLKPDAVKSLFRKQKISEGISLSHYRHPIIRSLITENKFYGNTHAQSLLAILVAEYIKNQNRPLILIPVPLSKKRLKERGYNQVEEVLKRIPSDRNMKILSNICERVLETKPQVTLSRSERLQNTRGAFSVKKDDLEIIKNSTILIIDDVSTTGATFADVKQSFKVHLHPSNEIICVAIAH